MRKVSRRLACVFATAVTARASAFAPSAPERAAQRQEQQRVGDGRGEADAEEADQPRLGQQARDAAQVVEGGAQQVHARVGVVDPVDRDLVDAHALALREHEQLGVEEPPLVAHARQQLPGGVGADRLEPALRVGEAGAQHGVQQPVVAARDQLALGAAHDPRAGRETRPDRHVAVPGQQRGEQRRERAQVGRQVGVHVADHVGVAALPGRAQRAAAALLGQRDQLDARQVGRQRHADLAASRRCSRCPRSRSASRAAARRTGTRAGAGSRPAGPPARCGRARRRRRRAAAARAAGAVRSAGGEAHAATIGLRRESTLRPA